MREAEVFAALLARVDTAQLRGWSARLLHEELRHVQTALSDALAAMQCLKEVEANVATLECEQAGIGRLEGRTDSITVLVDQTQRLNERLLVAVARFAMPQQRTIRTVDDGADAHDGANSEEKGEAVEPAALPARAERKEDEPAAAQRPDRKRSRKELAAAVGGLAAEHGSQPAAVEKRYLMLQTSGSARIKAKLQGILLQDWAGESRSEDELDAQPKAAARQRREYTQSTETSTAHERSILLVRQGADEEALARGEKEEECRESSMVPIQSLAKREHEQIQPAPMFMDQYAYEGSRLCEDEVMRSSIKQEHNRNETRHQADISTEPSSEEEPEPGPESSQSGAEEPRRSLTMETIHKDGSLLSTKAPMHPAPPQEQEQAPKELQLIKDDQTLPSIPNRDHLQAEEESKVRAEKSTPSLMLEQALERSVASDVESKGLVDALIDYEPAATTAVSRRHAEPILWSLLAKECLADAEQFVRFPPEWRCRRVNWILNPLQTLFRSIIYSPESANRELTARDYACVELAVKTFTEFVVEQPVSPLRLSGYLYFLAAMDSGMELVEQLGSQLMKYRKRLEAVKIERHKLESADQSNSSNAGEPGGSQEDLINPGFVATDVLAKRKPRRAGRVRKSAETSLETEMRWERLLRRSTLTLKDLDDVPPLAQPARVRSSCSNMHLFFDRILVSESSANRRATPECLATFLNALRVAADCTIMLPLHAAKVRKMFTGVVVKMLKVESCSKRLQDEVGK